MQDLTGLRIRERIILRKYDGDPPAPGEHKEPIETIEIEDGRIVARTVHTTAREDIHGTE
jgi:hypothetical protein